MNNNFYKKEKNSEKSLFKLKITILLIGVIFIPNFNKYSFKIVNHAESCIRSCHE